MPVSSLLRYMINDKDVIMLKRACLLAICITATTAVSAAAVSGASIWEKTNKKLKSGALFGPQFTITSPSGEELSTSTSNSTVITAYGNSSCTGNIVVTGVLNGAMTFSAGQSYRLNSKGLYQALLNIVSPPSSDIRGMMVTPESASSGTGAAVFNDNTPCFQLACNGVTGICTTTTPAINTALPPLWIAVDQPSLMFVNRDYSRKGLNSSYNGFLTIKNTSSTGLTYTIAVVTQTGTPTVTKVAGFSTCDSGISQAPDTSCIQEFNTTLPLNLSTRITVTSATSGANTVVVPVTALSVVALAPPTGSTNYQGLRLVAGCSSTSNDEGVLQISNNGSALIYGGKFSVQSAVMSGLPNVTITDPAEESPYTRVNNYCNGSILYAKDTCEIRVNPGISTAGASGIIKVAASTTPPVYVNVNVAAQATTFDYTASGTADENFVFVAENSCNLVEEIAPSDTPSSAATWDTAANNCDGTINSLSDWRLPDTGPTPGVDPSNGGSILPSGEFSALNAVFYNSTNTAGIYGKNYWGPYIDYQYNVYNSNGLSAWAVTFTGDPQFQNGQLKRNNSAYIARCARAFVTNVNGN